MDEHLPRTDCLEPILTIWGEVSVDYKYLCRFCRYVQEDMDMSCVIMGEYFEEINEALT